MRPQRNERSKLKSLTGLLFFKTGHKHFSGEGFRIWHTQGLVRGRQDLRCILFLCFLLSDLTSSVVILPLSLPTDVGPFLRCNLLMLYRILS